MPTKAIRCITTVIITASALAIPSGPVSAAADPKPPRAALLTVADLPAGFQPADELNDVLEPGQPDPAICTNPVAVGSVVNRPAITSYASFFRKTDGLLVYEILIGAGPDRARKLVADLGRAPKTCPRVRLGDLTLSVSRMSVPDLGAQASGVLIETGGEPAIRTRLIVFAEGGVTAIVMAVGAQDVGLRGMHTIALSASRKLSASGKLAPSN
ncbi:hypothetical protein [Actinoplanes sp. NPDC026619]|uniref:hypothetical protein n=1 Tax=Actinoplanes sp. NPDC026619 TaxID=3155798 RepID=UPI0033DA54C8